jgi:multimeric flavodoxin WrbA
VILTPFLRGITEAGGQVDLFHTKRLRINPCRGDFDCWLKHPGVCRQKDDMQVLHPKMRAADVLVLATPVFVDGMTGPLKNVLDRMIPLIEPFFELRDDHCRHPLREDGRSLQVVLVANCGFWELDNFDPLVAHVKAMCKNMSATFAGALLRPHGAVLAGMLERGLPVGDVLVAARDAGHQLIQDGAMRPETLAVVSRPLLPRDALIQNANRGFQRQRELFAAPARPQPI